MSNDLRQALTVALPRLRRFGLALTGSASDADDLVQNTCERALKHADQLRELLRLDAWLYGIMRIFGLTRYDIEGCGAMTILMRPRM